MYAALLTWTYALSDKTGFLLQRSTDSGSSWAVNYALASTASSYIDSNVLLTNTYWYRIAATNNYGTGGFSNTGSVFIPYGIPNPPSLLGVTSGSAILNWTYYSSSQQGFNVERSASGDLDWVQYYDVANPNSRSWTDTNVTESISGSTYWYRVNSYYAGMVTGSYSNSASITFTTPPPLGPENVIDGGFESGAFAPNWTTGGPGAGDISISTSATYVHAGTYGVQAGPWQGNTGYLAQVITLSAGTYTLSFWMNASDGGTMFRVYWEGVQIANLDAGNAGWTKYTYTVTATGPTSELKFDMLNEPAYYGIDEVSVR